MEREFSIEQRKKGDIVILDVHGDITIGGNDQLLKDTVSDLIARKQMRVIVNLKDVEFMDSSGVGALVKSYTSMTNGGGRLKLLQLQKMIRKTLQSTGLLAIFESFEDESEAIASF